jgi:hypothetical protein
LREAAMMNPTGESESDAVRLDFGRRLMLQFRGSSGINAVRLQLHALAYNLGNFLRTRRRPSRSKTGR